MITELTGNESNEDFTNDLRERIKNNIPYPSDVPPKLLPREAYVIVDEVNEDYTNYRAVELDNKWYIPVATYTDGCRNTYTMFGECKDWANIYGVDNIYVGVFADLFPKNV